MQRKAQSGSDFVLFAKGLRSAFLSSCACLEYDIAKRSAPTAPVVALHFA